MLFAPKSGEETRGMLKSKADEGREYLKRQADAGTEYIRKQATDLRDAATGVVDKGMDVLGRQKDTLNDAIAAGKQAYREKIEPNTSSQPA
jgi:gas vesicle protein